MPREPDHALAVMHGSNLAWAITNVPGTALTIVGSKIVAFVRDTGHAPLPPPRPAARTVTVGAAA